MPKCTFIGADPVLYKELYEESLNGTFVRVMVDSKGFCFLDKFFRQDLWWQRIEIWQVSKSTRLFGSISAE